MQPENSGIKAWQWVVTIIVIIIIVILGYWLFSKNGSSTPSSSVVSTGSTTSTVPVSTEANSLVVTDQYPGNVVYLSSVRLANPGFVVIQTNNGGTPGAVIGTQYFAAGINPGKITLTSPTVDGGLYYASLYSDSVGNQQFDITKDSLIQDSHGTSIIETFHALANVPETKG
ncbi:MAG: hypothetical protein P4L61_03010 [Candidatus Pacebacteria bacterium]|nr:hypothetical protein [Candidatus Paceibacterota bacterium]